jgi:hypothetical protein
LQVRLIKANNTQVAEPVDPKWNTISRPQKSNQQQTNEVPLSDLKEQTSYEVEVTAQNSIGWSDPSKPFFFTTARGKRVYITVLPFEVRP